MSTTEILTVVAIVTGPVLAVLISQIYMSLREKRHRKTQLFLTLLATRQKLPVTQEFADALNQIDVVFHGEKEVIAAWKELFKSLHSNDFVLHSVRNKILDLLDEMAKCLGYDKIKQTDFDDFYVPRVHGESQQLQDDLKTQLLRVLENSESFGPPRKDDQKPKSKNQST